MYPQETLILEERHWVNLGIILKLKIKRQFHQWYMCLYDYGKYVTLLSLGCYRTHQWYIYRDRLNIVWNTPPQVLCHKRSEILIDIPIKKQTLPTNVTMTPWILSRKRWDYLRKSQTNLLYMSFTDSYGFYMDFLKS